MNCDNCTAFIDEPCPYNVKCELIKDDVFETVEEWFDFDLFKD
jgi:hypothetical protein